MKPRKPSASAPSAPAGALLERYRFDSEIGRGGLGVVYRAHDTLLDRPVAVKVVDKPELTPADRERLLREARLVARLNHPNIIAVHDAGDVNGTPYIVMEYVDGVSLFDRPPASLAESVDIARQLCHALSHAHAHGVVHRDLKPENILRLDGGAVKLADFGLAIAAASRISREGVIVGTVFYLAPEQIQGTSIDGRADLYALGALLYEWSTGELPFTAKEAVAVLSQHLYAPVVPPRARLADVPVPLDRLIVSLLGKSPNDRPASADEVLAILDSPNLLVGSSSPAELPLLDRIQRGRMVGRESEMERVRQVWSQAQAGNPRTLLVCGEPGIGKSRLVRELVAQASLGGAIVLQGWNVDQPTQPLAVARQMLRGAFTRLEPILARTPESALADLLTLIPEAQGSFPDIESPVQASPAETRQRLFESLTVLLSLASQEAPTLVILEDAQWADSASLDLLRYLVQQIRDRPVLFVLTFRPAEPTAAPFLHQALLEFQRDHAPIFMHLAKLDQKSTVEMIQTLFDGDIDPALADQIFRFTQGNPFFIEEVCKGMAESGAIARDDGRWTIAQPGPLAVPPNVRVAIRERIQALPVEAQRALQIAAVRGVEFEAELVQQAGHLDPTALTDALEAAKRADLVRQVGDGHPPRFAFVHALIPTAMVEDLPPAKRRSLHAGVAAALESIQPDAVEALAHHFQEAGVADRAAHYLSQAGDRAYDSLASQEAIESFSACARLLHQAEDLEAEARALMKLGLAYSIDYQFDRAQETYRKAFDLWEELSEDGRPPSDGGEVEFRYVITEPLTLDPANAIDSASYLVIGQLMEGLVEYDEACWVMPALAIRWDVSDEGRRYVFYLRRNQTWSDGRPVTAGDLEYAWKRNLSQGSAGRYPGFLRLLENVAAFHEGKAPIDAVGVRAASRYTLDVRLSRPAAYLPYLLALPETLPLPRWVVEGENQPWDSPENFVGNGPFRIESWVPGKTMVFRRNPFYRRMTSGNVTRVQAPLLSDESTLEDQTLLLRQFDESKLDGIHRLGIDPKIRRQMETAYRRRYVPMPSLGTVYLGFHCGQPPFDDVRVRRAFAHAIDRQALVDKTAVSPPRPGGFLPPGLPGHAADIGLDFDPDAARSLLAEAGHPEGEGFAGVEVIDLQLPSAEIIEHFIVLPWRALGIPARRIGLKWAEYIRRRDVDPPFVFIGHEGADSQDPDQMLRSLFHSREGSNIIHWKNARFDGILDLAATISNPRERIKLYQQADQILVEQEVAVVPLWYLTDGYLMQPYVKMPLVASNYIRFKDVAIDAVSRHHFVERGGA